MSYTGEFDFFYGMESERYHFLIVPKLLIKDMRFCHVSVEAERRHGQGARQRRGMGMVP